MPRIVVDCQSGSWRIHDFEILVDGAERARVGRSDRADVTIEPGSHVVQVRLGQGLSSPLYFRIEEHETVGFSCVVSGAWRKSLMLEQSFRRRSDQRFGPLPVG